VNNVTCDRTYWPECGTKVPAIPTDLQILWDDYPDQASVFVAEALTESNHLDANFSCQDGSIVVYLWSVGGDTLSVRYDLQEEIKDTVSDYMDILSEPQAEEVAECVQGLQALEDAVRDARVKLENKLTEYREAQK